MYMGKLNKNFLKTAGVALAALCVVFITANAVAPETATSIEVLGIAQALVTIVAIVAGGSFAAYKWQVFRESEPHLTITHEVSHRPVGDSYVHIAVTAVLHNSSRVQIELREGFFLLQQVAPALDQDVEALYAQVFADEESKDLQWPTLDEAPRHWGEGELVVEPGERHPETFEFLVSKDVEAVSIYTYFHNSKFSPGARTAEGWVAMTFRDIMGAKP